MTNKIEALAQHLDIDKDDITESSYDDSTFEVGSREYMVCTDYEADEKWEESLNNYLDECVYPSLPENIKHYFDDEAWKCDARYDGRGHSLNHYDGSEEDIEIDGEWLYIYRVN